MELCLDDDSFIFEGEQPQSQSDVTQKLQCEDSWRLSISPVQPSRARGNLGLQDLGLGQSSGEIEESV